MEAAKTLRAIAEAERHHEERSTKLLRVIEEGVAWRGDGEVHWTCVKCATSTMAGSPLIGARRVATMRGASSSSVRSISSSL